MLRNVVVLVIVILAGSVDSAKILGLFTSPSKSHHIIHKALMKELVARGHEVTSASMFPADPTNATNYHQLRIAFKADQDKINYVRSQLMKTADDGGDSSPLTGLFGRAVVAIQIANNSLNHPLMKTLMDTEQFDLVILGWFMNDFALGISGHFKCPTVVLSTMPSNYVLRGYVGNPTDVTHAPASMLNNINPLVFMDRLKNYMALVLEQLYLSSLNYFYMESMYQYNFPAAKYPSLEAVRRNVSLVLLNYHYSQGVVRSYVPGMVEVGGLHINTNPKELPVDIKQWLDDAPNGVIYFSLGTNLRSSDISDAKRNAILKVFASTSAKVLWKWESDYLANKPENVMTRNWLPQEDVLNHKNVRLFISHCGGSSVNEAIFYGVPVLGLPIFADQHSNVQSLIDAGMAIGLKYSNLTASSFSNAVNECLNNDTYLKNARRLSKKYKDRPLKPMDSAVYWIEYVLRHDGARFMQSPAVYLDYLQLHSIDVVIFLVAVSVVTFTILKVVLKICRNICSNFIEFKSKVE